PVCQKTWSSHRLRLSLAKFFGQITNGSLLGTPSLLGVLDPRPLCVGELGEHLGCFLDWCAHAASPPLGAQTGDEVVWRVLHHWSKVGGRPASKTSRCGCGQPFSRMQRSRIARVVATNDTALHPLLPPDPRR